MLDDLKFIHERDASDALAIAPSEWAPTTPTSSNLAKKIALDCMGKSVIIYAGPELRIAAQAWKEAVNSIAHHVAWCGELSDSETAGWQHPVDKLYTVIELHSDADDEATRQRFADNERQLSGRRPAPLVVDVTGQDAQLLGQCVALYLALLNGVKT